MDGLLRIVHAEDNAADAELAFAQLRAAGINSVVTRVQTAEDFARALEQPRLDLIMSDFSMPAFDGISALNMARERRPEVPFIFLSGTIREEVAIRALENGAMDYVLKDRASRLVSCVQRAINEAANQAQQRKVEQQLREQAAQLDHARDAIHLDDLDHNILRWNKGAERLYGWTAGEALGRNSAELLCPEGSRVPAAAHAELMSRGEWQGEIHQTTKAGESIVTASRWTLMRDADDTPKSILVVNTDVTEKKRIEAQLLQMQRMETIGALAGGVAHDLNNALAPIFMAVEMLEKEVSSQTGICMLQLLAASARRSTDMVRQILSFSRGVVSDHVNVPIQPLVTEMVQFARRTFPNNIKIQASVPDGLPGVAGNVTQLHQLLLNLCVNARDAMPDGGSLTIKAEALFLAAADLPAERGLTAGRYLLLAVSDTGQGIPDSIRAKIFEPFFTTKGVGKGTGLGLSTVMGIIKTHGGFLELASHVGLGTTFKIYLPACRADPFQSPAGAN